MAESLRTIVDVSEHLRIAQAGVIASEDSQAAAEFDAATSEKHRRALFEAHQQGLKSLVASFDLALGAVDAAGRPDRAFSLMSLLRSSAEAASTSFWYLDPSIVAPEREARAIGGVTAAVGVAKRFGRKGRIVFDADASSSIQELERDLSDHPADARTPPSLEKKIRGLARSLDLNDSLSDAGLEAMSSVSHVTKNALDQIVLGWDDEGVADLATHLATEWAIWFVANLILAAVLSAARFLGWNEEEWAAEVIPHAVGLQDAINQIRRERSAS